MSIVAYTGLPGGGKSYGVVENTIVPALKAGRRVMTNIPMQLEALASLGYPGELVQVAKDAKVEVWLEGPPGTVYVVDECWRYWPAGVSADAMPTPEKAWFAEHRHRVGQDGRANEIVLVVQDLANVASFIRLLVEETYRVTKLAALGSKKSYRVDVYSGSVTGQRPPKSQHIRMLHGKYKKEIYSLYKSHTQSTTGFAGLEEKADKRGTVWQSWTIKFAVVAICLIPFLLWGVYNRLNAFREQVTKPPPHLEQKRRKVQPLPQTQPQQLPATAQSKPDLPLQPAQAQPVAPLPPAEPSLSKSWRIVGVAIRKNQTGIAFLRSAGAVRRISLDSCDRRDLDLDLSCLVDGELVTYYSGTGGSGLQAASLTKP